MFSILFAINVYAAPETDPYEYTAPSPGKFWLPENEREEASLEQRLPGVPQDLEVEAQNLSLADLVDAALRNNPSTRRSWAMARAKSALWGKSRSEYYPTLDAGAVGNAGKIPQESGGKSYVQIQAGLSYLLLDFGGRSARVEAAKQSLLSANWQYNQEIQNILRDIPKYYYIYIGSKANVAATKKSLIEAQTSLEAAKVRREAGVSTIADVLQAKAQEAEVKYQLVSDEGAVKVSRGNLATTVGWSADTVFEVANESKKLPTHLIKNNVQNLITEAQRNRSDLKSKLAQMRQKKAELKDALSAPYPKLSATGNAQWLKYKDRGNSKAYFGGLQLEIPIFAGFSRENTIRKAKAELSAMEAEFQIQKQNVVNDIWSSFYNFRTSIGQVEASIDLLNSSTESYDVSFGRYKAGAADIIELLDAQSTLADARAKFVTSRMNLYVSFAELIHAVGAQYLALSVYSDEYAGAELGDIYGRQ